MRYTLSKQIIGNYFYGVCKKSLKQKGIGCRMLKRQVLKEYKQIIIRA